MFAAHLQRAQGCKLFGKTAPLLQASLKWLCFVLAKEGCLSVLVELCLITALQCTLWVRSTLAKCRDVCLKPFENCATYWQGRASSGNVCCHMKSLMQRVE